MAADAAVAREGRPSLRLEAKGESGAIVRSAPVSLTIGRSYELAGWIRTADLAVRDLDRSPVALGASLSMASMPFDVHSESLGGTHDWTRVSLRFIASRSQDEITVRVADGGAFSGKAWFDGITLDEASAAPMAPAKSAVKTFGPAYRYPKAGWIYLHIEGDPYERGYQHGSLMPNEIAQYLDRCAASMGSKSRNEGWEHGRAMAKSLFLDGFDDEIRAEMRGIADGAAAAGCRYDGRKVDLLDIATANVTVELGELNAALPITGTGLEMLGLKPPVYAEQQAKEAQRDHCSAFAATGKATRDGHMIIAHTTWWPLTLAEQTNVMLDIRPKTGHRMLIQSYPGGIESGTDWYQNDAGMVLTETTINQTPFNREGTPVAYRARKAIQYGGSVDEVARYLSEKNNGLYSNGWLIGDGKNDEIAVLELGTNKSRLWRSSKNDWNAGVEDFYWGNNNAKDLAVRLEATGRTSPRHVPYHPDDRDSAWLELYDQYRGRIDERFAFLAFRTSPLVSGSAMDAKVATAEMARNMMVWAAIGKPNQTEWVPRKWETSYDKNDGLYPSGYALFAASPSSTLQDLVTANEAERRAGKPVNATSTKTGGPALPHFDSEKLWNGIVLPASDADTWLTAGAQRYWSDLSSGGANSLGMARADYAFAAALAPEIRLKDTKMDPRSREWFVMASRKGELFLDALRQRLGDDGFLAVMRSFYTEHDGRAASTADFRKAAEHRFGKPLNDLFGEWIDGVGLPGGTPLARHPGLIMYAPRKALIVYGTDLEAGANRFAAEKLQANLYGWLQQQIPIRKDFELTDEDLRTRDLVFIGRPETNSALRRLAGRIGLSYDGADFQIEGKEHSSEHEALVSASASPSDAKRLIILVAGNTALQTVKAASDLHVNSQYSVLTDGHVSDSGFLASPAR